MGHYYYYWDPTYILVVIGAIICMIASAKVKTTFNKYSQYRSYSGMNGAQVAQRVLEAAGIYDVTVRHVSGNLTDHYDPSTKTVNLSDPVYNSYSVAALGVAAHECGHAIQHAKNYAPLSLRSALGEVGCVRPPLSILQILYVSCFRYPQTFNSGGWSKPGNTKRLLRGRNRVSVTFDAYMVSAPFSFAHSH